MQPAFILYGNFQWPPTAAPAAEVVAGVVEIYLAERKSAPDKQQVDYRYFLRWCPITKALKDADKADPPSAGLPAEHPF